MTRARAAALTLTLSMVPVFSSPAAADTIQDPETIRAAAKAFVLKTIGATSGSVNVEVSALDTRLRLAACGTPLEAFRAAGGTLAGNTSVGVRCHGPRPWSLYVPVRVVMLHEVLVTARPLPRGAMLKEGDLRTEKRDVATAGLAPMTDRGRALGRLTRQPIAAGVVLRETMLQAPYLVRRGDRVAIRVAGQGLEVRAGGEALMDGAEGDRVRVRNLLTKKVIQGTVTEVGVVEVTL